MNWILDRLDKGERFALYTGRGPSSGIHLGHMVPWIFTKWLQDKFRAPLWFQVTDDEKYLFRDFEKLEDSRTIAYDNILDIIAIGFDPKLTKIFIDTEYIRHLYPMAVQIAKRVTFSTAKAVFGFDESYNIGQIFYTAMQSVPCFLPSVDAGRNVPVLIPCGIDQDPHFRVTRDVAERLGYYKPAGLYSKLMPGLQGLESKMSTSQPETAIFATDTEKPIRKKVSNAFTGGRATVEEQRKLGANPYICSVFAYYTYLFAPEDAYLADVERTCSSGERLCGDCKGELADHVVRYLKGHQERRENAKGRLEEFLLRD
jgi:tryptophanyl-tRNA synthetase